VIDLDAYLQRIGYAGPRDASPATLDAIHRLHPAAIPFENLDPLLGRPVRLDLPSLEAKLVRSRRGGYCFEHNTLLAAALEMLGFAVTPLAARVRWMAPPEAALGPRNHMLLSVAVDDAVVLADVGFGGHIVTAPLRLVPDVEQPTPGGPMRLRRGGASYMLELQIESIWREVYWFSLEPQLPADVEVANWYTSTHPQSHFRSTLVMQRVQSTVRTSLRNRRLTRRFTGGLVEDVLLADARVLAAALDAEFAIDPPCDADAIWDRLPA
jgi:N-hydroxyarylamine O-acetyltransferase